MGARQTQGLFQKTLEKTLHLFTLPRLLFHNGLVACLEGRVERKSGKGLERPLLSRQLHLQ